MPPRRIHVPFGGTPPAVKGGDHVEVRDAGGRWHPKVALDIARYDDPNGAFGKVFLTVPVANPEDWAAREFDAPWVNWPAEDVRPVVKPAGDLP